MTRPHLCHLFPAFNPGGPEVRTAAVINASNDTFRHTVISMNASFGCQSRIHRKEAVTFVGAPPNNGRGFYPLALAQMLQSLRPDLLLTYNWGAIEGVLAARLCGIRRVIHAEDGFGPDETNRQKIRRRLARQILLRVTARVICPSRNLVRIATHLWRLPACKVSYVPNGVDGVRFSPRPPGKADQVRQRFKIADSESVAGTVGHLREEKNHARLIRAFSVIAAKRKVKLLIVGHGQVRERLDRLVQGLSLEDRVVFTGAVSDPLEYYRAMDVFALSSDTEQMPIVILEAMSVGLPIVSTDIGDVSEMVSPPNRRYVVPTNNNDAYADALAVLIDDARARALLGQANRERCLREYDETKMIERYLDLYREVLETGYP